MYMDGDGCLARPHASRGSVGSGTGVDASVCVCERACAYGGMGLARNPSDVGSNASAVGGTLSLAFDSSSRSSSFSRCSCMRDALMSCTWLCTVKHLE